MPCSEKKGRDEGASKRKTEGGRRAKK